MKRLTFRSFTSIAALRPRVNEWDSTVANDSLLLWRTRLSHLRDKANIKINKHEKCPTETNITSVCIDNVANFEC